MTAGVPLAEAERQINRERILIEEDFVLVSLNCWQTEGPPEKENRVESVKYAVLHSSGQRFEELESCMTDYNIILRL